MSKRRIRKLRHRRDFQALAAHAFAEGRSKPAAYKDAAKTIYNTRAMDRAAADLDLVRKTASEATS